MSPTDDRIQEMRCPVTSRCHLAIGENEIKPSAAAGMGPLNEGNQTVQDKDGTVSFTGETDHEQQTESLKREEQTRS